MRRRTDPKREPQVQQASSKLLINEPPLQVLPTLASLFGLNEAIVLQQLHYWLQMSENEHDGFLWVYNTYDQWKKQFPFWDKRTIQRAFTSLEEQQIIKSCQPEAHEWNQRKWYRIDYSALEDEAVKAAALKAA